MTEPDFPDILQHFELAGHFDRAERMPGGHINDTWLIRFVHFDARKRYVLQRINETVFPDPLAVMHNIDRITTHIRGLTDNLAEELPDQRQFVPVRARDGGACWQDDRDGVWRLWPFVYGASTRYSVASPEQARVAARAFGCFQRMISNLPGSRLHETIAGFHDTPARFRTFASTVQADACGRASGCQPEIEFALASQPGIVAFFEAVASGELPERVAHNDAKITNIMIDGETGTPRCIIDLDTVMPGLALNDFGDMVRTMAVTAGEDETDLDSVAMQLSLYAAVAEGYLDAAAGFLTAAEVAHLPDAARIITLETGLRFLTDYLSGDRYFRTSQPHQNLDRCRTQFALVRSIDAQWDEMRSLTDDVARKLRRTD